MAQRQAKAKTYRYTCVDCPPKNRRGLSYASACRSAERHAVNHPGHKVFLLGPDVFTVFDAEGSGVPLFSIDERAPN